MLIRQGVISDFERLNWAWRKDNIPTQKIFKDRILEGKQEFWVVESSEHEELLGEFHIVWNSFDPYEADGLSRAYICAFRIHPEYRGQGLGRKLKDRVLQRVKEAGKTQVTIGVKSDRPEIREMYKKWGFTELIKTKDVDHHNFDSYGNPNFVDNSIELYLKYLIN
ncbi:GNAT family N-acetyltransferase [Natranaerobius trueperi]|uniref:N-acetyltransferase domain-containing protein n=1 Tax=Natranaerobius trueperi TaxID=759412 RepID=A0A226C1Z2_9FIRM|nr:GNAT family N-acetyltransferase [Natranaerobius trueperi]OWZ84427.1 hypothetical protein CDO51_02670 [Natranaerobius trueperi]